MGEVLKLKGEAAVANEDATAAVVAWLREMADELEKGDSRPVHKAVLSVFEDRDDEVRVKSAFCNVRFIERVGIMYAALNDVVNSD